MSSQSIGSPATLSVRTSHYLRRFIVRHRIVSALLIVGLCVAGAASSLIPRSFAVTNGGSMNAIDTPLTENFNTLATTGTPTWTDNTTIPGWYSSRILYQTGSGTSSTGGLYSFGIAGVNPVTDRALGSLASGTTGTIFQGVKLTNNTGVTVSSLDVSYVGEQWRNGGNTATHNLVFQYQVANAGVVTGITSGSWTNFPSLDFSSLVASASAASLDGNNPANRTAKSATLTVNVNAGQEIWLRWQDVDDSGNDHGMAVDDFSVTPHSSPVDSAPAVLSTTPANNATNVAANSNLSVTFTEPVSVAGNWFQIACANSGTRQVSDTTMSGGPSTFTIDPTTDFTPGEQCTATVFAAQVSDQDVNDPPDNMVSNFAFTFTVANPPVPPGTVVISQVYGGGGNSGATLKNDFIEIINHTASPVNLGGWSVQYASATQANWQVTPLTNFVLQPGQYYLIREAAGAGGTVDLPTPDALGTIAMGAGSGKVALVSNTTTLSGNCPASNPDIVDFVGYDGADCFEGTGAAPTLTNTTAALRGNGGCADTNDNAADFTAGTPNPRNSATATHDCTILSAAGSANPSTVQPGDSTTLTVDVSPAPNPPSTGIMVTADLSSIGGSASQIFSGSGNSFSFLATVAIATPAGMKSLPVSVTDSQGRTANTNILLSVQPLLPANHVTISQVYGGGGNSGATYTNDYVELYNPTGSTVSITGWSLQYGSATGTSWTNKQPLGGIIGPGEYYLVSLGSGGAVGAPLPASNISGDINMAAGAGKVALVNNSDFLSGGCPLGSDADIVDFVGYGATANCHEGSANAPAASNTAAIFRKANGLTDTDQNGADFSAAAPNPRRTAPIVELGPWVAGTDPLTNDTVIPHDATITVNFSEPVSVDAGWYNINCNGSLNHNDATVAFTSNGKTYAITPNSNFQFGEQCTVTINKDAIHDVDTDDNDPNTDTLFENYVWSFSVVAAGAVPYPSSVHLTMGNPSNAVASLLEPDNYLMEKPSFTLSYNRDKGSPNWVSWHLDNLWTGNLTRDDTFRPDPAVPSDWYRVEAFDFFSTGFDRGHMTPNADRNNPAGIPLNQETFLMSNMVAQAPGNNQGPWADLESFLRTLLPANELYIVSGPFGVGGTGANGFATTLANGHVTVPAFTWKVALVLPKDDNDLARVNAGTRTIAVIMPNQDNIRGTDWHNYLTTVDAVEDLTGYDFFANVPDAVENAIEAGTNGVNPPGTEGQSMNTAEDTARNITLTAVGSDGPLTYTIVTPPAHGDVTGLAENQTYTPALNFNGPDSFTFRVSDANGVSNTSTVNITVTVVNDDPTAVSDDKATDEDNPLTFSASDLLGNDSAGPVDESGQTLTVTAVNSTVNTHGTVSLSTNMITYTPAADFNGAASFEYQVCDNGTTNGTPDGKCVVGTVNVTVNPQNDVPLLGGVPATATINELSAYSFTASTSDIDVPAQTLTFSLIGAPSGASIDPSSGQFTWTPSEAQGGTGVPFTFKVRVSDGVANCDSDISLSVNEVNQAPILNAIGSKMVLFGDTLTFNAEASDGDLPAQTLAFSLIGAPGGAAINATSGAFSWTPTIGQFGQIYTFKVRVTDDGSPNLYDEEQINVGVGYTWSGLLAPVQAGGVYKVGRTIPIKFQLTGPSAGITTAVARLLLFKLNDNVLGDPVDVESTSAATTGNLFRYSEGQYIFNLDTSGLTAGTYQLQVDLGDGILRAINISLK